LIASKILAGIVAVIVLASVGTAIAWRYETNNTSLQVSGPAGTMVLKVESAAMEPTINEGSYILVNTTVKPSELAVNYPNSDLIVFHDPIAPSDLIVDRIVSAQTINGTLYFKTKGDANGNPYPQTPTTGLDPWDFNTPPGVPQDLVVGKVINTNYK